MLDLWDSGISELEDLNPIPLLLFDVSFVLIFDSYHIYSKDNDLIVESKTLYYSYPVSNEELKGFVECVIKKYPNYKKLIEVC